MKTTELHAWRQLVRKTRQQSVNIYAENGCMICCRKMLMSLLRDTRYVCARTGYEICRVATTYDSRMLRHVNLAFGVKLIRYPGLSCGSDPYRFCITLHSQSYLRDNVIGP